MTHIHSEIYGEGQPLLMIHGWAMHTGIWRDFAQMLAQHYQVICVDLPGHGRSEVIEPYSLDNLVRSLLPILPAQPTVLLGWSLGATVAMAIAREVPKRVKRLCILAGNPHFIQNGEWPGVKEQTLIAFSEMLQTDVHQTLLRFLALQVNGLAHGKSLLQTLKRALAEAAPPHSVALQAGLNILKTADLRNFIGTNSVTTQVLLGAKDTLIPVQCAEGLLQLNPNIEMHVLSGAGHAPFLSHPQQLLQALNAIT